MNVIFVRQYQQSFRGNRSSSNSIAFELTTVPYPLPIRQVFVTKRLDFWRNGRYRYGVKLNIDKITDLEGNWTVDRLHAIFIDNFFFLLEFRSTNYCMCFKAYARRIFHPIQPE